jgi:hypothetical protein
MKYIFWMLITGIVGATAISCRSTKKIQTAINKKDTAQVIEVPENTVNKAVDSIAFIKTVYSAIQKNRIDFKTFNAKVKVNFEGSDGKNSDFNAFLRIRKDSVIWVSIIAALGIEAFKVMITPDSVKVLDKLDKVVKLRSVSYLQELANIPLTFKDLQDIIIGNPVYLDSNVVSYVKGDRTISLLSVGNLFKHFLTVGNGDYSLQHSKLDDVDDTRARTCDITYGSYENADNIRFSTYRMITVSEKSKLDVELQFKQFDFNAALSFPFNVPKNFKRQ